MSAARCKHQQLEKRPWVAEPAGLDASTWRDWLAREVWVPVTGGTGMHVARSECQQLEKGVTGTGRFGWQQLKKRQWVTGP